MDLNMNLLNTPPHEFPDTAISLENGQQTEEVTVMPVPPEQYKAWVSEVLSKFFKENCFSQQTSS